MSKQYIRTFDFLRGLAALAVCLFHSNVLFGINIFMPHAYLAVDFFFILSGFIMIERYYEEINKGMFFSKFAVIRVSRLYPLFFFVTIFSLATVALPLIKSHHFIPNIGLFSVSTLMSIFVLPNFFSQPIYNTSPLFPFSIQAWSIFWEFIMSGIFFFWARSKLKFLPEITIIALIFLISQTFTSQMIDGGWQASSFVTGFARAFFGFSIGILTALKAKEVFSKPKANHEIWVRISYVFFILAVIYIGFTNSSSYSFELMMVSIGFPIIIFGMSKSNHILFNNKFGDWLGGISYSLYLLHVTFIWYLNTILKRISFIHPSPLVGTILIAFILLASTIIWIFFEKPAQKWCKEKLSNLLSAKEKQAQILTKPV